MNHSKPEEVTIIKTPDLKHVKSSDWNYVYEPAEDSFLLLDTLEKDLHFIQSKKPRIVLEVSISSNITQSLSHCNNHCSDKPHDWVGCGSGVIITAISQVLSTAAHCLAVDINPHACRLTKSTSYQNHSIVDVIQADLVSCLMNLTVDMIVFNPPYVVTPDDETIGCDLLTKSWAGGADGTKIINKFVNCLEEVLAPNGFGYLLVLKENHPQKIMEHLEQKQFCGEIISERKLRGEELFVIKFVKKK